MFKRYGKLLALTALALLLMSSLALAGAQDFKLTNKTGYPIYKVNCRPAQTDKWLNDILQSKVLPDGATVKIQFPRGIADQYWDVVVVFKDNSGLIFSKLDLFNTRELIVNNNGQAEVKPLRPPTPPAPKK